MRKKLLTLFFTSVLVFYPSSCVYAEGIDTDKESIDAKEMLKQTE